MKGSIFYLYGDPLGTIKNGKILRSDKKKSLKFTTQHRLSVSQFTWKHKKHQWSSFCKILTHFQFVLFS